MELFLLNNPPHNNMTQFQFRETKHIYFCLKKDSSLVCFISFTAFLDSSFSKSDLTANRPWWGAGVLVLVGGRRMPRGQAWGRQQCYD